MNELHFLICKRLSANVWRKKKRYFRKKCRECVHACCSISFSNCFEMMKKCCMTINWRSVLEKCYDSMGFNHYMMENSLDIIIHPGWTFLFFLLNIHTHNLCMHSWWAHEFFTYSLFISFAKRIHSWFFFSFVLSLSFSSPWILNLNFR